jgi:hypothetical protein
MLTHYSSRITLLALFFNTFALLYVQAQGVAPVLTSSNGTVIAPKGNNGGIRTNFDAPSNTHLPAKTNTFDWRTELYNVNWLGGTNQVYSPFYQINNSSINHLFENKDMLPEDGWELFAREFGYKDDGTPEPVPTTIPTLVLYNRYTGMFRVFVMRHQYYPYTDIRFVLSFQPTLDGMETTLIDQARPIDALNRTHSMGVGLQSGDRFLNESYMSILRLFFKVYYAQID